MPIISKLATLIAVCVFVSAPAFAAAGSCVEDAAKLCKNVKPGGGRLIECLKQHENEVSDSCKTVLKTARSKPCASESEKFCKDVPTGGGRLMACLREHEAKLSEACKGALAKAKTKSVSKTGTAKAKNSPKTVKAAPCKQDVQKFCDKIEPGEGRIAKCLQEHETALTAACRAAITKKSGT